MSGIEFIVGTTLASIPLALEAYDRSGRVFEVFKTFKHYPREVTLLEAKLSNQRTIFRNNAVILLTAITKNRFKVREVMKQPSSPAAENLAIASPYEGRLDSDSLNESFLSCRRTAEQVNRSLQFLYAQFEAFRVEVDEKKEGMSSSEWLKHVRTRFKLGLYKPKIGKAIDELRGLNTDFGLITEQIVKSLRKALSDHADDITIRRKSIRSLNILNRYHRVRYASKALHSTLQVRWMCSSHRRHVFDVRVLKCGSDQARGKGRASVLPYITCELAITHDGSYASKCPLRLEVEQACESDDEDSDTAQTPDQKTNLHQLTTVLESNVGQFKLAAPATKGSRLRRLFGGVQKGKQQQPGPSVTSRLPTLMQPLAALDIKSSSGTAVTNVAPLDLSQVDDFCRRSEKVARDCRGRALLGSWQDPHAKWFCVPSAPQTTSQSLSEMIRWIAEEPVLRSLPRPLLVELAGDVAEGLMDFYSTPWLTHANLGQNVRYFNPAVDSPAMSSQLEGPYFVARVDSTEMKPRPPPTSQLEAREAEFADARNKLFDFGILLLEIGFGRPWHQLKQIVAKSTAETREGNELSDYRAAEELAQLLLRHMGLAYTKIIRKCLACDFGLGETDLDNEDLQRRFVNDVVLELQRLKEDIAMNFALLSELAGH
ncbi:hypothetical protein F4677DRAFT_297809 [Hypoxylon crocopeplum]|nr:hypothetical protein F4677DRAFT_297809 [Hypoxylon crocopeplum]